MAEKFDLSVILSFINKTAPGMKSFQNSMKAMGQKMKAVGRTMSVAVTAPIVGLGVNAIRMGSNFQEAMNMVGAVTGATGKTFDELKDTARNLGATTQYSAIQAGEAMKFMGMAGFDANKIIAASPKVLQLAAAAQLDMASAADITTNIMSGFGFEAKDMARVNDVLVNTFTNANVSLPQMGEALKKVGPIASKLKMRFTEVSAALGILGNNGIQGSEAGVALRRAMINLQKPTKQMKDAMAFMELEFANADGSMKDLTGIIGEYEKAAEKGASETDIMTSMMTIFGARAVAPMLALLEAGSKGLQEMEEKTRKQGTASQIAERQMQGLPGALKLMKSAWESVNIALTEGQFGKWVEEIVRGFAGILSKVSEFIKTNPELVKIGLVIAGIAAAVGPLLVVLGLAATAIGVITAPIAIGVLAAAGIVALAALIIKNWTPIKQFFLDIWEEGVIKPIERIKQVWSEFITLIKESPFGKAIGVVAEFIANALPNATVPPEIAESSKIEAEKARTLGLEAAGIIPKTQTEITLKVESADGKSITVQNVKGDGKVKNQASIGPTMPNLTTINYGY